MLETAYKAFDAIRTWFTGAGAGEWALIISVLILLVLIYLLLTWFLYKWQSDFVYKAAIFLISLLVFTGVFLFIFWMEVNNWQPLMTLIS